MHLIRRIPASVISISILIFVGLVFFCRTILFGSLPVPSDSLVGLYHPWRDFYANEFPRGIPFKNFLTTDPVRQQIPWRHTVIEELKRGHFPSWSPYTFSGSPLAANIQSGAWYPFNILFFIFDFPVAWSLLIILEPMLMMVAMFIYLHHLHISERASIFGSILWAFSGFSVAWLTWGTIDHVAVWLPLLLYITDHLLQKASRKAYLGWIAAFIFAQWLQLSAGHTQTSLYTFGIVMIYSIWRYVLNGKNRTYLPIIFAWIVTCLVTIPIWRPMIDLVMSSNRIANVQWTNEGWFFPWQHVIQFIAPDFFGNPTTLNYWGVWNYGELVGYLGMAGIICSLGLMTVRKTKDEVFWMIVCATACVFMTPNPIAMSVYQLHIPVLSSLQATRLMFIVDFSLVMLAVYGFSRFEKGEWKHIVRSAILISIVMGGLGLWSYMMKSSVSLRNLVIPTVILLSVTVSGILAIRFRRHTTLANVFLSTIVLITTIDVFRFAWKFTPFTPPSYFFPTTKTISFLRNQSGPFRVMSVDDRIFAPNTLEYFGLESVSGYDPLYDRRYATFVGALENHSIPLSLPSNRIIAPITLSDTFLDLLNVRYILTLDDIRNDARFTEVYTEGQTKTYEYNAWKPRVYFATDVTRMKTDGEVLKTISANGYEIGRNAIIAGDEDPFGQSALKTNEKIDIIGYEYGNIHLKTVTMQERFVIFLTPNHTGWHAYIDGIETLIRPTNYLFMGVWVTEGTHRIDIIHSLL